MQLSFDSSITFEEMIDLFCQEYNANHAFCHEIRYTPPHITKKDKKRKTPQIIFANNFKPKKSNRDRR